MKKFKLVVPMLMLLMIMVLSILPVQVKTTSAVGSLTGLTAHDLFIGIQTK